MSANAELSTLAVVVVNYRSASLVDTNLSRSLDNDFPGRVVVVDNFSSEEERKSIAAICERRHWQLLTPPVNEGFGGGCNRGASYAIETGAEELLFLNPDAWLTRSGIEGLHAQVRRDHHLQLAPTVMRPDGHLYSSEIDLYLEIGEMKSIRRRPPDMDLGQVHTWVSGACFAISAELWKSVGGFDDDFFLYWEDVDLSRRIVIAGGTVRADRSLVAVHDEGSTHRRASDGSRAKSPIYYYFNARNRLLYAAKHLGPDQQRKWVRSTPRASYGILLQGGKRQFARPWRNIWPALRGSWDGLRLLRSLRG